MWPKASKAKRTGEIPGSSAGRLGQMRHPGAYSRLHFPGEADMVRRKHGGVWPVRRARFVSQGVMSDVMREAKCFAHMKMETG